MNASVSKAGEVGIMSIFLDLSLTPYPARAVCCAVPPDAVSLLVAGLVSVGTNVPKVR
jgi:hypothetical protein